MAHEIENLLHAAVRVNGIGGAVVLAGAGIDDASVARNALGEYQFELTSPIAPDSEAVCGAAVEDPGPTMRIVVVEQQSPTLFVIRTFDDAQPAQAADATWSVVVFRGRTGP